MIEYFETHIEDFCNMKCRGCSHFSGLVKGPRPKSLADFEKEFKRLSEIEKVGTIRLMGGEPLINEDFMEYVRIARRHFPKSRIVLVTNGILAKRLLPCREELIRLSIVIVASNYHDGAQDLNVLQKFPLAELHEKGDLYNISLDLDGKRDARKAFDGCDLHQHKWFFLKGGRLYACCVAGCIDDFSEHFGLTLPKEADLGIDIFTHTADEIEEYLARPNALCRYCDTERRERSYARFSRSKGDIHEWSI